MANKLSREQHLKELRDAWDYLNKAAGRVAWLPSDGSGHLMKASEHIRKAMNAIGKIRIPTGMSRSA